MEFLTEVGRAIPPEVLPQSAPDLNPVEWLRKSLKKVEVRNRTYPDLEESHLELPLALGRVRQESALVRSVFEGTELDVYISAWSITRLLVRAERLGDQPKSR